MRSYSDIVGDGGSDVAGQVDAQQRAIESALSGVRQLVAVGSGKGGVGKSTLTMGLAWALRRSGCSVAILDLDFNGPCQAQLAGMRRRPWVPRGDGAGLELPRRADGIGVVSFGSLLADAHPMELPSVAVGEEQVWRGTREAAILRELLAGVAWGDLDILLLDLPPGAERTRQLAQILDPRTAYVLVTVPSDVARGVVARSLTAVAGSRVLGYVENMAGYVCRGCDQIRPLFPASATELPIPRLAAVPFDPVLAELCDGGWPMADGAPLPSSPSLDAVSAAADGIRQALEAPAEVAPSAPSIVSPIPSVAPGVRR